MEAVLPQSCSYSEQKVRNYLTKPSLVLDLQASGCNIWLLMLLLILLLDKMKLWAGSHIPLIKENKHLLLFPYKEPDFPNLLKSFRSIFSRLWRFFIRYFLFSYLWSCIFVQPQAHLQNFIQIYLVQKNLQISQFKQTIP